MLQAKHKGQRKWLTAEFSRGPVCAVCLLHLRLVYIMGNQKESQKVGVSPSLQHIGCFANLGTHGRCFPFGVPFKISKKGFPILRHNHTPK